MTDDGESCTSSSDSDDRPVKKARFLWEIKGRYRLKKDDRCLCSTRKSHQVHTYAGVVQDVFIPYNAINKWQNQQMAKAVFDNTVNSVIENMGFSVPVPDLEYLVEGFNQAPDDANGRGSNNGYVEDEAVQMAIRSHGLQKPCSCPQSHYTYSLPEVPFHRRPREFAGNSSEETPGTSASSFSAVETPPPAAFPKEDSRPGGLEHDFLAEAVAVAIQKKGLGAFNQADNMR